MTDEQTDRETERQTHDDSNESMYRQPKQKHN